MKLISILAVILCFTETLILWIFCEIWWCIYNIAVHFDFKEMFDSAKHIFSQALYISSL